MRVPIRWIGCSSSSGSNRKEPFLHFPRPVILAISLIPHPAAPGGPSAAIAKWLLVTLSMHRRPVMAARATGLKERAMRNAEIGFIPCAHLEQSGSQLIHPPLLWPPQVNHPPASWGIISGMIAMGAAAPKPPLAIPPTSKPVGILANSNEPLWQEREMARKPRLPQCSLAVGKKVIGSREALLFEINKIRHDVPL